MHGSKRNLEKPINTSDGRISIWDLTQTTQLIKDQSQKIFPYLSSKYTGEGNETQEQRVRNREEKEEKETMFAFPLPVP